MGRACGVSTELRCGVVCTVQLVWSTGYRSGYEYRGQAEMLVELDW